MSRDIAGVLLGDIHAGHIAGLCPPGQWKPEWKEKLPRLAALHAETWKLWRKGANDFKGCDIVVSNGDNIEGQGQKSSGIEIYQSDRKEQSDIAAGGLAMFQAKKYRLTRGTPYHVGDSEEFEDLISLNLISRGFDSTIHNHWQGYLNGKVFDCKHHIGGSQTPYSETTPVSKERIHNLLWSEKGACAKADVIVRSHCHFYAYAGNKQFRALTLPALQAPYTTKYGRKCSRTVDWGILPFEISKGGNIKWHEQYIVESLSSIHADLEVIN